ARLRQAGGRSPLVLIDTGAASPYAAHLDSRAGAIRPCCLMDNSCPDRPTVRPCQDRADVMKVRNSLRFAKIRDKNCRVVRRRGRVYVINKKNPRMKARQGCAVWPAPSARAAADAGEGRMACASRPFPVCT